MRMLHAVRRFAGAAVLWCAVGVLAACAGRSAGEGASLVGVIESLDPAGAAAVVRIVGGVDVEQAGARVRVEPEDRSLLGQLKPGDSVRLRFMQSGGAYVLTGIERLP